MNDSLEAVPESERKEEETLALIAECAGDGLSEEEIANRLRVSRRFVRRVMRDPRRAR